MVHVVHISRHSDESTFDESSPENSFVEDKKFRSHAFASEALPVVR